MDDQQVEVEVVDEMGIMWCLIAYVIGKYMIVKDVRIKYKSNDELNLLESDDLC